MMPKREFEIIDWLEEHMGLEKDIERKRPFQGAINNIRKYYNMEEYEDLLCNSERDIDDSAAIIHAQIVGKFPDIYTKRDVEIGNLEQISDRCGVYIYTTMSGKRYVGHSVNVKSRISQHKRIRDRIYSTDPIIKVTIFDVPSRNDAVIFEWKLIKELKPELNIQGIDSERELNISNSENRMKLPLDVYLKISGLNELKEIYLDKIKFIEKEMYYLQNRKYQ